MATWHQTRGRKRNPAPLYHSTLWTVLIDPPGGFRASMLLTTQADAEAYRARLPAATQPHTLILKPATLTES